MCNWVLMMSRYSVQTSSLDRAAFSLDKFPSFKFFTISGFYCYRPQSVMMPLLGDAQA